MVEINEIITILEKNGQFAAIGLMTTTNGLVSRYDPRRAPPNFFQLTETPESARTIYRENVNLSVSRGWRVIYSGSKLQG